MMQRNNYRHFGIMLDCSRDAVMNIPTLKKWIDIMADLGYNTLMLYTEDTYEVDNQPYFGYLRGRYSQDELREIDTYAFDRGIELIPAIQTLAHLNCIFRWGTYSSINDCNDILLAGADKTYELIDNMFASLEKTVRTRTVNIGMDEAHMLGRGKYQDIHGFEDRFDILLNHLNRVSKIAEKHGFECIMWGDMFFRLLGNGYDSNADVPERIGKMIPKNVNLVYWDYYSTDKERYSSRIKGHSALKDNIWFAGGLWSWTGFAPHNAYSIAATKAAFEACSENNVQDAVLTMWGDDGSECSKFSLLPSLYYSACIAKGCIDEDEIKNGFYEKYGIAFDDFMLTDLTEAANQNCILNPDKYMLYNDCFLGLFDSTVDQYTAEKYVALSDKLKKLESHPEYGYMFKKMRTLCDALALKFDLGVRTREAYNSGDKAALSALISDYERLLCLVDEFYNAFRTQWMTENKPQGFEVHDIRLGGLYFRIKHCKERLEAYTENRLERIEELEETLLDFYGKKEFEKKTISFNLWKQSVSTGCI